VDKQIRHHAAILLINKKLKKSFGEIYPKAECLRLTLYQPSMYSKIDNAASLND
jgi:hypothetical protein